MPKREPTPPPGDDEPKYLTICYPYPPHANMQLPGDRLALARWLVCAMGGSDDLYAIFHKPSAPNMIIIEVRKYYTGFRRLLGAHKWSDFVRSPGDHGDKITRIYFSTYSTGRAVEKAGWKRIFIEDSWFENFNPNNKYIMHPYPLSTYCDPPTEDQTGFTLCRPIPRDFFYVSVPAPPPVPVGSANWITQKGFDETKKKYAAISPTHAHPGEIEIPSPLAGVSSYGNLSDENRVSSGTYSATYSATYSSSGVPFDYSPSSPVSGPQGDVDANLSGRNIEDPIPRASGSVKRENIARDLLMFSTEDVEDEFGTFTRHPERDETGQPLCPSHGVICKKGICRDYSNLLKRIEREKRQAFLRSRNYRGRERGGSGNADGHSSTGRGRGRGSFRAQSSSPFRGRKAHVARSSIARGPGDSSTRGPFHA